MGLLFDNLDFSSSIYQYIYRNTLQLILLHACISRVSQTSPKQCEEKEKQNTWLSALMSSRHRWLLPPITKWVKVPHREEKNRSKTASIIIPTTPGLDRHWSTVLHTPLQRIAIAASADPVLLPRVYFLAMCHDPRAKEPRQFLKNLERASRLSEASFSWCFCIVHTQVLLQYLFPASASSPRSFYNPFIGFSRPHGHPSLLPRSGVHSRRPNGGKSGGQQIRWIAHITLLLWGN